MFLQLGLPETDVKSGAWHVFCINFFPSATLYSRQLHKRATATSTKQRGIDKVTEKFKQSRRVVLLAEDDMEMRLMLSLTLQGEGWSVIECKDGADFLSQVEPLLQGEEGVEYDLIVTALRMPGATVVAVIEGIAGLPGCPPIILITAFGDADAHARARELGAAVILDKPFDMHVFTGAVYDALKQSDLQEGKGKPVAEIQKNVM